MSELTPSLAALLAKEIYTVQNERDFKRFATLPMFVQDKTQQTKLNATIGGRIFRKATDGFGLCAMGESTRFSGDAFFIFRGTTEAHNNADVISDVRIGTQMSKTGTAVHIGFNEIFKSMLSDIRDFVKDHKITGTIHCIGHSLGGAVATLAADWLSSRDNRVKLYTFGQPRVGFSTFSQKLTTKLSAKNIHRVFHSTDPVPMIPIFPYVHNPTPGNGHFISSDNLIISGEAHKMNNYSSSVKHRDWLSIKREAPVFNHETAIKEWLTSKISPDPENPRTWEWLDAALIFVLKKILGSAISALHTAVVGVHTLADRIAWILMKGIDLAKKVGTFVMLFIKKTMQILGMAPLKEGVSVSRSFLNNLLTMLMRRAHAMAKRAIQGI